MNGTIVSGKNKNPSGGDHEVIVRQRYGCADIKLGRSRFELEPWIKTRQKRLPENASLDIIKTGEDVPRRKVEG